MPTPRISTQLPAPSSKATSAQLVAMAILVCAVTAFAHWRSLSAEALYVDDHVYVINNPLVMNPGWASASRFLTEVLEPSTVRGYYQPLAMISLMLDVAMGGGPDNLQPFHRTSLIIHILNTLLIALLLYQLFRNAVAATLVATVFGVHPLTVEPVIWIADRKTLLAAMFALFALCFYLRFVRTRGFAVYAAMLAAFVLSVLSKPTAAMLPLALLLIDIWPLNRLDVRSVRRINWQIIIEKLPLFAVLITAGLIAYLSSKITLDASEVGESNPITFLLVLCHNIVFYFWKIIWPVDLTPHYPFPPSITLNDSSMIAGLIVSAAILAVCLAALRRTKAPLIGYLSFVILLLPTLSIIKQTITLTSDKYIYFPAIGLLMLGCAALSAAWRWTLPPARKSARVATLLLLSMVICIETVKSREYANYWRDSETLYTRVVSLAPQSSFAWFGRGHHYYALGKRAEAERDWREAVRLHPGNTNAVYNLGLLLEETNRTGEALILYENALQSSPLNVEILVASGLALQTLGRMPEAEGRLREAVRLAPAHVSAVSSLANLLSDTGRLEEARTLFQPVAAANPNHADVLTNYGRVLLRLSRYEEARPILEKAVALAPASIAARYNLGAVLLQLNRNEEAIAHLQEASRLQPGDARVLVKLARAMAGAGRVPEAIRACETSLQSSPDNAEAAALLEALKTPSGRK